MARQFRLLAVASAMIVWLAPNLVHAEERLRFLTDLGGHNAIIRSVIFTPDGKGLISAGDDKVIRVWDLEKEKTVRTIRGYIGAGDEGKIYAMALSSDGATLAVAGRIGPYSADGLKRDQPAHWIRLHDFKTGKVKALLKGHEDVVNALAFSADGKQLLSGSSDKTAILWTVAAARERLRLRGHTAPVLKVAFKTDISQVVTAGLDQKVNFWDTETGKLLPSPQQHKGRVGALSISTSGAVASGSADGEIIVHDVRAGMLVRRLVKLNNEIGSLSYSPDGQTLLVGVGAGATFDVAIIDAKNGQTRATLAGHDEIVLATAFSPDGKSVATGGGQSNEIFIWDVASATRVKKLGGTARRVWASGFSSDGSEIAWGYSFRKDLRIGRGPYEYRLRLAVDGRSLGEPGAIAGTDTTYLRGRADVSGWSLTTAPGGASGYADAALEVRRNGETEAKIVRENNDGYRHTSYTFTPEGDAVVSGGAGGTLSIYDLSGGKIGDFVGHEGEVWAVTASRDGRYLVSGGSDGTVRLWNLKTRELILSLLEGGEGEWVAWTPQGYYTSSPSGDRSVGWQVNRGFDSAADYYSAAQLRQHFFRPDIVARAIELASARDAVQQSAGTAFKLDELLKRKPPQLAVVSPAENAEVSDANAIVKVRVQSPGDPVSALNVYVNDREVTVPATRGLVSLDAEDDVRDLRVPLSPGGNIVRIVAQNAVGETAVERTLLYRGPETTAKGKLFIVAIGVNRYDKLGARAALQFAATDAQAFTTTLKQGASDIYDEVKATLLTSDGAPPTRPNIEDALALFKDAGPNDTSVLYLAGHGVNEGLDYLFLPQDAETQQGKWRSSSVVPWNTLQKALQKTQGRRLMFVDTCHSGGAYNARLTKDAVDSKIIVFSATDANTLALEKDDLKHGVFTWAVVQGMKGGADFAADGAITVLSLGSFVSSRVVRATQGYQKPAFHFAGSTDFILAKK